MSERVTWGSATIGPEDPGSIAARNLIDELVAELSVHYGPQPSAFTPSQAMAPRTIFLIARIGDRPVGCGALRNIDESTVEIKRMYVAPSGRRQGLGRRILAELERHAAEFGYQTMLLETGIHQHAAIALYESCGFRHIPPFGPYVGNAYSVCFQKDVPGR